jgi:hypothetical protein
MVSAFGAGFFDDAGDIPGSPVIWYTLRGTYATGSMAVNLRKVYERQGCPLVHFTAQPEPFFVTDRWTSRSVTHKEVLTLS